MKRHTPSLESVWAEWHRRERLRKMRADRAARGVPESLPTPPNSVPWLSHPPRSLDDLWLIAKLVEEHAERWKSAFMRSSAA